MFSGKPPWKRQRSWGHPSRPLHTSSNFARLCLLPLKEEIDAHLPVKPRMGRFALRRPSPPLLSLERRQELLLRMKRGEIPRATLNDARFLLRLAVRVLDQAGGKVERRLLVLLRGAVSSLKREAMAARQRLCSGEKAAPAKVAPPTSTISVAAQRAVASVVLHLHGVIENLHIEKGANVTLVIAPPDAAAAAKGKQGKESDDGKKKTRGPGLGGLKRLQGMAHCPYVFESHESIRFVPLGRSYLFKRSQDAACQIVNRLAQRMKECIRNGGDWYAKFTEMDAKILRSANPDFLRDCVEREGYSGPAKKGNHRWNERARLRKEPEKPSV